MVCLWLDASITNNDPALLLKWDAVVDLGGMCTRLHQLYPYMYS